MVLDFFVRFVARAILPRWVPCRFDMSLWWVASSLAGCFGSCGVDKEGEEVKTGNTCLPMVGLPASVVEIRVSAAKSSLDSLERSRLSISRSSFLVLLT